MNLAEKASWLRRIDSISGRAVWSCSEEHVVELGQLRRRVEAVLDRQDARADLSEAAGVFAVREERIVDVLRR